MLKTQEIAMAIIVRLTSPSALRIPYIALGSTKNIAPANIMLP